MDALSLNQVHDLLDYWKTDRPAHLQLKRIAAALFEEDQAPPPDAEPPTLAELQNIAGMFPG